MFSRATVYASMASIRLDSLMAVGAGHDASSLASMSLGLACFDFSSRLRVKSIESWRRGADASHHVGHPVRKIKNARIYLFTRNGDLIRDLDKYVRSGQPCFSQLQNEVKNPFAYAKTRYGKEPKFVYHYTDNESLRKILKSGEILPSLEQDGDAKMGDGVYMTTKSLVGEQEGHPPQQL